MTRSTRDIICVEDVVKDFRPGFGLRRKRVLHGVSFVVREGEIFGFVGPNGAGKTTMLKVLMDLIRPTSGRASILGSDVSETEFRHQVGFLPENPYFYPFLTAREILTFYAKLSGMAEPTRSQRVAGVIEWVGLEHAADARLKTYSKGMLQRVGIAQSLVHDPIVVFLDEPMSGLDPLGRKEIRDIILRLKAEGKTVFMNTHILTDVEMICDRVAIIVEGQIRYQGTVENFLEDDDMRSDVVLSHLPADLGVRLDEDFDARIQGVGDRIEIHLRDKDVSRLLEMALAEGAEVVSVTQRRISLESIFLETVAKSREGSSNR
ncbi:MAG: ABC transporter ATP-binding protein [Deltaproteobacteria bacterium]|nr:ABC transporter ATP-binding protein [Deltaproteobacteria bacterium]MBW2384634.1 ABC transporter ATP-binding protein [Deltaproteobacteria bacterium]